MDNEQDRLSEDPTQFDRGVTRRKLLVSGGRTVAAASLAGSLLSACGSAAGPVAGGKAAGFLTNAGGGTPVRGGTLTVGMISGGSAEQISPATTVGINQDIARISNLYDGLFTFGSDLKSVAPALAVTAEPSSDAKVWSLRLRSGVTWHDGKPFSSDDVLWTINQWASPKHFANPIVAGMIDFKTTRKRGPLVVEIPLLIPVAQFPSILTIWNLVMQQNGEDPRTSAPIGTGPFKFQSFTPGSQSVFVANHDYWQQGRPYVDKLVINTSFTDETSRFNALLSGSIDVLPTIPYQTAKSEVTNGQIKVLRGPPVYTPLTFPMNLTKAPFTDVRVRQAMRLIADREALVSDVFLGLGTAEADLFGRGTQYFDASLTRTQDIEQAKSLLKAAGHEGLTVQLKTSAAWPGMVEGATLYAEQASAAGVTVNVQNSDVATYYTTAAGWLSYPFSASYGLAYPSLSFWYRTYLNANAVYNETAWGVKNPSVDRLLYDAFGDTNPVTAQDKWTAVQKLQFDEGGYIVWGTGCAVDAVASAVRGLSAGPWSLNYYRFLDGWLT